MESRETIYEDIWISDEDLESVELSAIVSLNPRVFDELDNEMEYDLSDITFDENKYTKLEIVAIYTHIEDNREDLEEKFIEGFQKNE